MRQVMIATFALVGISMLSGCTVVDPEYNYQMGGFPMYSAVKKVSDSTTKKSTTPHSVQS